VPGSGGGVPGIGLGCVASAVLFCVLSGVLLPAQLLSSKMDSGKTTHLQKLLLKRISFWYEGAKLGFQQKPQWLFIRYCIGKTK
jgi:hypothetical protein